MTMSLPLPPEPGTYALVFVVHTPITVEVGRLGKVHLMPGTYVYVGSARGPGGLAARVARHLRPDKPLRWHVDYLTARQRPVVVCYTTDAHVTECTWAQALLARPGTTVPLRGMGSSDCRACPAHFLRLADAPSLIWSRVLPGAAVWVVELAS